jgi:hypothetical protein
MRGFWSRSFVGEALTSAAAELDGCSSAVSVSAGAVSVCVCVADASLPVVLSSSLSSPQAAIPRTRAVRRMGRRRMARGG